VTLFSAPGQASLKQSTVKASLGLKLSLSTGDQYLLRSTEPRTDPLGRRWQAAGNVAEITGLTFGLGRRKQQASVKLSALDPIFLALAQGQTAEVRGRKAEFFMHLFNQDWSYVEAPTSLGIYIMDKLTVQYDGESMTASIALTLEPLTATRFRSPNSYLDDRDQQARYPGDTGLAFMGKYVVSQTLVW